MPGDDVDLAIQPRLGDFGDKTFSKMRRHVVGVIVVQAQLPGDLLVQQVQPHEIKTQEPGPKRLMMSSQDGSRQVIEPRAAVLILTALNIDLRPWSGCDGSDALWSVGESDPGITARDALICLEHAMAQVVLAQELPDVLDRIEFRTVGRQMQQADDAAG